MKPRSVGLRIVVIATLVVSMAGCVKWKPGWEMVTEPSAEARPAEPMRIEADAAALRADSREDLEQAIGLYRQALAEDPEDGVTLARLSEYTTLLAAGYTDSRGDKAQLYIAAVQYAERALFTNPDFRDRVEAGMGRDEAVEVLGENDMYAMHFWVTALSYYFKECLNPIRYPFNMRWMNRTTTFLTRMQEIDAEFENGASYFAWGIYYMALPRAAGGDRDQARANLEKAVEIAPHSLLARWGRAKYFHVKLKDRDGFVEDLEWVLAQDPEQATSPYPWNVYFQRDARAMLDNVEGYF